MIKIKKHNFVINSPERGITIRSLENNDIPFYKEWFKKFHFKDNIAETLSEEEIDFYLKCDIKRQYIFIVLKDDQYIGEITIWKDTAMKFIYKTYGIPIYNIIIMQYYEKTSKDDIDFCLNLFLEFLSKGKIKIRSLYVFIDEKENNYKEIYFNNKFKELDRNLFKSKTEDYMIKNGIENTYKPLKILIREIN
jgi:hypothetical protein